jgi:hypothetical protein
MDQNSTRHEVFNEYQGDLKMEESLKSGETATTLKGTIQVKPQMDIDAPRFRWMTSKRLQNRHRRIRLSLPFGNPMKSRFILLLLLSSLSAQVHARFNPPDIEWQKSFGGAGRDGLFGFAETSDKGFVLGGFSSSAPGGNKTSVHYGSNDFWVIRINKHGTNLWEQSYGGSGDERISKIHVLSNGDILLAGYSSSGTNSVKTAVNHGAYDFWLVKIDPEGNKIWDRTYGGSGTDYLEVIEPTPDGGFLLGGQSSSPADGTKTAPWKAFVDYWLVKIDSNGLQLWDKTYSGSGLTQNSLEAIQPAFGGDFIIAGWSTSHTGIDKTATYYGSLDWWLLRIDSEGNKIWDRSYGGTGYETVWGVRESVQGSFLAGGLSSSADGTRTTGTFGANDYWILRLDEEGVVQWQKSHGGTGLDECRAFVPTADGGGLFCGKSASPPSGNKESLWFGDNDFWAVRVDANGDKIWETSAGGTGLDDPFYMLQTSDGGYLIGGWSDSPPNGNKTSAHYGDRDIWVVKLDKEKHQLAPETPTGGLTNGFSFSVSGLSNIYVAEFSTNLVQWEPFETNEVSVLAGVIRFFEATNTISGQKFFRTRKLNP